MLREEENHAKLRISARNLISGSISEKLQSLFPILGLMFGCFLDNFSSTRCCDHYCSTIRSDVVNLQHVFIEIHF